MEKKLVNDVVFTNVSAVYLSDGDDVSERFSAQGEEEVVGVVVVRGGKVSCLGQRCLGDFGEGELKGIEVVDLKGGALLPGLLSYGSPLGLVEITQEPSTQDGYVGEGLAFGVAEVLKDELIRASDGASFGTKDAL